MAKTSRRRSALALAVAVVLAAPLLMAAHPPTERTAYEGGETLIESDATWSYWRSDTAPSSNWNSPDYDDEYWPTGTAPLGYGTSINPGTVTTNIPSGEPAIRTTYFRHSFEVDLSQSPALELSTWADDGVVIFVNGRELVRERIDDDAELVHDRVWANAAIRTTNALNDKINIQIPSDLLRDGQNTISALVAANWRQSHNVTFGAELTVAGTQLDPNAPLPSDAVIADNAQWQYWRSTEPPQHDWKSADASVDWPTARAPLGTGSSSVLETSLPSPQGTTPLQLYARHAFTIDGSNSGLLTQGATFTTWADDGAIYYINGREIGRQNVDPFMHGKHEWLWANAAPSTATALQNQRSYAVPGQWLNEGVNVLSAKVISNYRSTPNITFGGELVAGGGGEAPAPVRPQSDWELVWNDEFDGVELSDDWYVYDNSTYGVGGDSIHCLYDDNVRVDGGNLVITTERVDQPISTCEGRSSPYEPDGYTWTSGHVHNQGAFDFTYGRMEIRAIVPVEQGTSKGMWPAFWLRPVGGGTGEIDVLEPNGSGPNDGWLAGVNNQSLHYDYSGTHDMWTSTSMLPDTQDFSSGYHTFAAEWTPTEIRFFVDDEMVSRVGSDDLSWYDDAFTDKKFFIRLNTAVGGAMPGDPDSSTASKHEFIIDYVRIYQPSDGRY